VDVLISLGTLTQVRTPPNMWREAKGFPRMSSPLVGKQGHASQIGGPIHVKFESISDCRSNL